MGALAAVGCGSSSVTVDVFAASSLTDAFTELESAYEAEHPGVDIRLNLAGSDTLRRQIDDGATAHVFAPAAIALFDGLDVAPVPYASNQLEIVANDPAIADRVQAGDLDGLLVARCTDGVPCGTAADQLTLDLGLDLSGATVTSEPNVRAVLSKVALGEADLGFVYRTDTRAADGAVTSASPATQAGRVVLAIGLLDTTSDEAADFVEFVVEQDERFLRLGFELAP